MAVFSWRNWHLHFLVINIRFQNQCLKLQKREICLTDFDYIRLFFEKNNHSSSNMGAEQKKDKEFQTFLDTHQYARKGILLYERIFGDTYVSTGGESTTAKFCSELQSHSLKVSLNFKLITSKLRKLFWILTSMPKKVFCSTKEFSEIPMWAPVESQLRQSSVLSFRVIP